MQQAALPVLGRVATKAPYNKHARWDVGCDEAGDVGTDGDGTALTGIFF